MTKLYAKIYHSQGSDIRQIFGVTEEDAEFFTKNGIKISFEELGGDIITYGCPPNDPSEFSELIVFSNGRPCIEVLSELAERCKQHIETGLWKDYM